MSQWPAWEDQVQPCKCGCGQDVSTYEKGVSAGFASFEHMEAARDKHVKQWATDEGLPTIDDVNRGRDKQGFSQEQYNKRQLTQKAARLDMLGFTGEAERVRAGIR